MRTVWWLMACMATSEGPRGVSTIDGAGVLGQFSYGSGCDQDPKIGLWGPTWGTDGFVSVDLLQESEGVWWAHFPVEIGLGTAMAALRLEGSAAQMPLGARPGEFSIDLSWRAGTADASALTVAQEMNAEALAEERKVWRKGTFLLLEGERVVGDIQFRGDAPPLVAVYDAWWLTPAPVPADIVTEGADLVLRFTVEPSMQGEDGMLRINVPLREVVVPISEVPVAEERRFKMTPGGITVEDRTVAIARARSEADLKERELVTELAHQLRAAATTETGCSVLSDLDPAYTLLLTGYDVEIVAAEDDCMVDIEPSRTQHGRRFKGRVGLR